MKDLNIQYPVGNPLVPYGTPLHVTELFLQLLKHVFTEVPLDYPYKYVPDDYEKTGIAFDVSLNKESEIFGSTPIVVISRGSQNAAPNMLGDLAGAYIPKEVKYGSNLYASSINFQTVSKSRAETEIISQHIFSTLMFYRTTLPVILNIHMVQSIYLGELTKMEDDDTVFYVQGGFTYLGNYTWKQVVNHPELKGISLQVNSLER